ncbi:MAG: PTS sugar transporter subunit IIC [Streptococcaceae bacterium]|jgi:PTS system mannose-specific IIC component|nr:PTS sugar transporter subunit IIC [Streptococcaceae bacterium]
MPIILQNLLIVILAGWMAWDNGSGVQLIGQWPVCVALVMGLITGDFHSAMIIGGTLQLMSMGIAALGGASIPEYGVATIVSIFLAARTGVNTGEAIAVGLPVGMLTLQLDVLVKYFNTFTAHWEQSLLHAKKFRQMEGVYLLSILIWMLKYVIPMAAVMAFGPSLINAVTKFVPTWFTLGLQVAGNMLPVLGVAILLHYMPVKKYLTFLISGFVLSAYLNLPILGVALLGGAAAYFIYQKGVEKLNQPIFAGTIEQGDDFDE